MYIYIYIYYIYIYMSVNMLGCSRPVRFTNISCTAQPGALGPMLSDHCAAASATDRPGRVLVFIETLSLS